MTSLEDGSILRMAPNYDNNMSLYGSDCLEQDRRKGLTAFFLDFLRAELVPYDPPALDKALLAAVSRL
jgi:hypothetical protein